MGWSSAPVANHYPALLEWNRDYILVIMFWHKKKIPTPVNIFGSEEFIALSHELSDAVVIYGDDFKVVVFNPAAERTFGLSSKDVVGKVISPELMKYSGYALLVQTVFPSLAPTVIQRSPNGASPQVLDISFAEAQLELRVSTSAAIIQGKRWFIKIIHDRTREVAIYRSKSEFITIAAHQLRTPLTAIEWSLDILHKEPDLSAENKEVAEQGFLAAKKLSNIVKDLLAVSKIEEGKFGYDFEEGDIVGFLKEIVSSFDTLLRDEKISIKIYFEANDLESLKMLFDPKRLGLAISNLIDNAVKYNVKNGSITVKVSPVPGKPYIQIDVADTGIGISAKDASNIFKKFYRTDEALKLQTEGSGLGLYIARNIIRAHGGNIGFDSFPGRGTTFHITLPTDPKLLPQREIFIEGLE